MTGRELFIGLFGAAASGLLAAIVYAFANRGKTAAEAEKLDAEAADLITRAAGELVDRVTKQAQETERRLLKKVDELEERVDLLTLAVGQLVTQLKDHEIEPELPPDLKTNL